MSSLKTFLTCSSILAACLSVGCDQPPPKPKDLGQIVFTPGEVPGYEQPYSLPEHLRNIPESPKDRPPPQQ